MIFLWLFLIILDISHGIIIKNQPDPFNQLIDDLLSNCPDLETVIFYGDSGDEVVKSAVNNQRKIQALSGRIENITVRAMDLLVIFLDSEEGWNRTLAGKFLGINTVFVVSEKLDVNQAKVIFGDFWNSSESFNVLVCSKSKDGKAVEILTYNPYNDYAPWSFWSRLGNDKTYFGRYSPGETKNICLNLLFERTKHLDNYPIKVIQHIPDSWMEKFEKNYYFTWNHSHPHMIRFPSMYYLLNYLMCSLKVSINLTVHQKLPFSARNNHLLEKNIVKSVDMNLKPSILVNMNLLSFYDLSYPINFFNDAILTHNRGLMTPLEKMFNFYGWLTIVGTLIIISVAVLVIYLTNNQDLSFSVFESLRLIVNAAIYSRMESIKIRIFFSMIFLYFLVIQATFSGHLAAFLTKPEYRKNIENLEDLRNPRYEVIYANPAAKVYTIDEILLTKTVFEEFSCNSDTIKNPRAACIESITNCNYLIAHYNLHYTKKPLVTRFSGILLRKNWRLKDRVNQIIMRMTDTGLNLKKLNASWNGMEKSFRTLKEIFDPNYYRPVELADLLFIFVLLVVGLLMGVFVFAGELAVHQWNNHQRQIRRRWRNGKRAIKIARRMLIFKIQRQFKKKRPQNSSGSEF